MRNERTGKQTDYLYLSGSLVAQVHGAAAPAAPALSAPGYITEGSVNLTWSPAGGANRYELQRALAGAWSIVFDGAAQSFTSTGLAPVEQRRFGCGGAGAVHSAGPERAGDGLQWKVRRELVCGVRGRAV
ncbi:hypothetical protein G6F32_014378 [Rhizopus arrhizus]|nr:hypothetical protein G6F32_014378 [Rhizopus arrhizus]